MLDEERRIEENLKIIREYLLTAFPGFNLTEDTSDPSVCHRFTLTKVKTNEQFKLKVGWRKLSDKSNTPEATKRLLEDYDVAGRMRDVKGLYLYW